MFASAVSPSAFRSQATAYQQVHVTTGVDNASPHELVGMLFDGLLEMLAEARGALRSGDIARKGRAISRAGRIVDEGLNGGLNMAEGGAIAADLRRLYEYIMLRLVHANARNDDAALAECVALIEPLRSGWSAIAERAPA